jgi:hypothetical protein
MTPAELSIALDVALVVVVLALLRWGARYERFGSILRFDLAPHLTKHSAGPNGEPLRSWKGAAYFALTIFLVLNAVALIAFALSWLGVWEMGSQVSVVFAAFGVVGALVGFLLQCPGSILKS